MTIHISITQRRGDHLVPVCKYQFNDERGDEIISSLNSLCPPGQGVGGGWIWLTRKNRGRRNIT